VGDGTTWNGTAWVPSAAAYKAGPFINDKSGSGRAGLELVQGANRALPGGYSAELQLSNHWTGVEDSAHYGRGHSHQRWMDSGEWIDSILHWRIDPADARRALVTYYEAAAGQKPVPPNKSYIDVPSVDATDPHPLAGTVTLALNMNQRRKPGQDLAIWYGFWEAVDGLRHPDPFGVGAG
jgi:hypothetical protein